MYKLRPLLLDQPSHIVRRPSVSSRNSCGAISRFQYYCAGETIGACKMPNDNNREMLTEVVALYLAAHMKAQAAVITTLVSILVQKGVLTEQIVRAEWLGGLDEVVRATLDSPQATNPDEARASRIEIETLRQVVDWIWQRLFPSGDMS